MKVALFSRYPCDVNNPRGGVEAVTVVLARALARLKGLDMHVVTLERGRRAVGVEDSGGVTVHRLPGSSWPQIADILVGPGHRQLVKYFTQLKADVVHLHETYGLGLGHLPIPHVFTVHGFDHANLPAESVRFAALRSRLWSMVERHGLSRQPHIISIAPYVREMIEPLTQARIYDIDNPVDERFFNIIRREEPGRILFAGWINPRKNALGLVQAFDRVIQRGMKATLVMAGEWNQPAYHRQVVDYIAGRSLGERVRLLGRIGHDEMKEELSRASVFVLPSRQENSPMAIAEAMAAGVPVISSNCCGMPYMVQEGETGFLVDPKDGEALADRLARLLTDGSLRVRMGQLGRHVAEERFHPNKVANKTLEVYRAITGRD